MRIAINKCYGGFHLSHKAVMRYAELAGITLYPYTETFTKKFKPVFTPFDGDPEKEYSLHYTTAPITSNNTLDDIYFSPSDIKRTDPILIKVIEELGDEVNSFVSKIVVVEIPNGVQFTIDDYDGVETIHEVHRSWG